MDWTERRERYRAVLAGDQCVHPGSVFDPISARIAEDVGFEIGMFAGSVASMTVLGAPDLIVLTLSEFAGQAYRICRAGNLALMVDADHGYGNALNVRRTVEELESAGISGLTIEDTDLPQPFGTVGQTRLLSVEEGTGKMRAALSARQDFRLAVIGRTSALSITGLDDAIARARAYQAAGVDAMFFTGVGSLEQLDAITDALSVPIVLGGSGDGFANRDELAARGVRVSLQGHQPFMAAVNAVHDTLKALREGTPPSALEGVAPGAMMKQFTRDEKYRGWMADFLGGAP